MYCRQKLSSEQHHIKTSEGRHQSVKQQPPAHRTSITQRDSLYALRSSKVKESSPANELTKSKQKNKLKCWLQHTVLVYTKACWNAVLKEDAVGGARPCSEGHMSPLLRIILRDTEYSRLRTEISTATLTILGRRQMGIIPFEKNQNQQTRSKFLDNENSHKFSVI